MSLFLLVGWFDDADAAPALLALLVRLQFGLADEFAGALFLGALDGDDVRFAVEHPFREDGRVVLLGRDVGEVAADRRLQRRMLAKIALEAAQASAGLHLPAVLLDLALHDDLVAGESQEGGGVPRLAG